MENVRDNMQIAYMVRMKLQVITCEQFDEDEIFQTIYPLYEPIISLVYMPIKSV